MIIDTKELLGKIQSLIQSISSPLLEPLKRAKILAEAPLQEPKAMVLQCSILPPTVESEVSKIAILRCQLSAEGSKVSDNQLFLLLEGFAELLCSENTDLGTEVYSITEAGGSPGMVDEKGRNIRVKDFYIRYMI
ncbi:MAG: hypothetical protein HG424_003685 [candidate division SR1 bacterium]|nr:hypothetical protein [candidate division SR1 bacterium]